MSRFMRAMEYLGCSQEVQEIQAGENRPLQGNLNLSDPALLTYVTYMLLYSMGRRKAGGYIFEWYSGDHEPFHVHVYRGSDFIGRFDVVHQRPMGDWVMTGKIKKALQQAGFLKKEQYGTSGKKN